MSDSAFDPYKILGVRRNASQASITKAYRKLSIRFHPDKNPGDFATLDRYKEIQDAYGILSDPEKRARFDATGETKSPRVDNDLIGILAPILANVLARIVQSGQEPDEVDVMAKIKAPIQESLSAIAVQTDLLRTAERKLTKIIGKFKAPDGEENLLQSIARSHLADAQTQIARLAGEKLRLTAAMDYLAKCGYDFVVKAAEPSRTKSIWRMPGLPDLPPMKWVTNEEFFSKGNS